jgi:23S rRNA G2445 N2-methylase RlmL
VLSIAHEDHCPLTLLNALPLHTYSPAMKESLAAGLLLAAGWKDAVRHLEKTSSENGNLEGITLVDPMCGSGSLLLEAAMITVNFAPGLMRIMNHVPGHQMPPVLRWKGNNERLLPIWKELLLDASKAVKSRFAWLREHDGLVALLGNDIHTGALELLEASLKQAGGLDRLLELHQNDCREWNALQNETQRQNRKVWVVTNPPWGVRLTDDDHMSWESLRTFLREKCPPGQTQAWVLSGNKEATKHLGLRRSQSLVVKTGEQDLRWIQYIMEDRTKLPAAGETDSSGRPRNAPIKSLNSNPPHQRIRTRSVGTSPTPRSTNPSRRTQRSKPPRPQKVSNADDSWI